MSIFKRKNAKEYSYDFIVGGVRFSGNTGTANQREAKREEDRLKEAARKDVESRRPHSDMTFEQVALKWMKQVGQHHKNALTSLSDVERLIERIGAKTLVLQIGNDLVAQVVAKRRMDKRDVGNRERDHGLVSNATVNRSTTELLKKILRRASRVWKCPVQEIDWSEHRLKEPKERVREASDREERLLLSQLSEGYDTAVRFAIMAGCRLEELTGLTWSRVDFFTRTFSVTGKNGDTRTIPMSQALFDLLFAQQGYHPEHVFTYVARRTYMDRGLVKGQRYPMTYYGLQIAVRRAVQKSGIVDLRVHDLRHTAATRTLRVSNLRVVQHLLGHADITTTAKYAHAQSEDIRAALDAASPTKTPTQRQPELAKILKRKG
jgi:integrase